MLWWKKVRKLAPNLDKKGNVQGFLGKYMDKKAQDFVETKEWKSFNDVSAFLIYGIIWFIHIDDFICFQCILGWESCPYTFSGCILLTSFKTWKEGEVIFCCIPLLYTWFMSHMSKKGPFIENQGDHNWPQRIVSLTKNSISWYLPEHDVNEIIFYFGDFLNVPLIGSGGCINYSPILDLRQLGYTMLDKPEDKLLEGFVLHYMGADDPNMLKKIRQAWIRNQ